MIFPIYIALGDCVIMMELSDYCVRESVWVIICNSLYLQQYVLRWIRDLRKHLENDYECYVWEEERGDEGLKGDRGTDVEERVSFTEI